MDEFEEECICRKNIAKGDKTDYGSGAVNTAKHLLTTYQELKPKLKEKIIKEFIEDSQVSEDIYEFTVGKYYVDELNIRHFFKALKRTLKKYLEE